MSKFISKKDLNSWLNKVRENRRLVAPTRVEDLVLFKEISGPEDIVSDYVNTALSPKAFLFPPTEVLFSIERKDGGCGFPIVWPRGCSPRCRPRRPR